MIGLGARLVRLAGVGAALATSLLLATCGTYRALTDDYADDYVIQIIRPLSAVSGETVQFQALLCSNAGAFPLSTWTDPTGVLAPYDVEIEYDQNLLESMPHIMWSFGEGADPNVSYEAEPVVTVRDGLRSPYECNLEIRYGCEDEDVVRSDFTLNVAPLSALGVSPTVVVAGGTAAFGVIGITGAVTHFDWDFGGAAEYATMGGQGTVEDPYGANPVVSIADAAGVFSCTVTLSNRFEAYQFPFTLVVNPGHSEGSACDL